MPSNETGDFLKADDTNTPFRFNLDIEGYQCAAEMSLPNRGISLTEFLPIIWKLQDALIGIWENLNAKEGRVVSCRAGCGACCRQLVPVSEIEAFHLKEVVDSLPAEHRQRVVTRFALAQQSLAEQGVLEDLKGLTHADVDKKRELGIAYFRLQIPCPFLEEESCSIHAVRPSACREYLVTSPAVHCASLEGEQIKMLSHSAHFSSILFCFADGEGNAKPAIIPLALALMPRQSTNPQGKQKFHAPKLFEHFLHRLALLFSQVS